LLVTRNHHGRSGPAITFHRLLAKSEYLHEEQRSWKALVWITRWKSSPPQSNMPTKKSTARTADMMSALFEQPACATTTTSFVPVEADEFALPRRGFGWQTVSCSQAPSPPKKPSPCTQNRPSPSLRLRQPYTTQKLCSYATSHIATSISGYLLRCFPRVCRRSRSRPYKRAGRSPASSCLRVRVWWHKIMCLRIFQGCKSNGLIKELALRLKKHDQERRNVATATPTSGDSEPDLQICVHRTS
jgi:hypothetical protein